MQCVILVLFYVTSSMFFCIFKHLSCTYGDQVYVIYGQGKEGEAQEKGFCKTVEKGYDYFR